MAVTPEDVDRIIQYDKTFLDDIQIFIDMAVRMFNNVIGDAVTDADTIDDITKYLAAHFIGISDPRLQSAQVKSLMESYQFKLSGGLGLTHHGAMAMLLDPSGKLARYNQQLIEGRGTVQFFWGGSEPT